MNLKLIRGGVGVAVALALLGVRVHAQQWTNTTGNLAYKVSECGNLTLLSAVPDSPAIIAGVAARGLWVNTSGTTWTRLSDVAQSERIANRPSSILYDPENPNIFWESGSYNNAGVFKTTDGGKTFVPLGNISHNDYISVDFSDPERRTLMAGGHEQPQTMYRSVDGGQTWRNIGRSVPSESGFLHHPLVLDALTALINVSTGAHPKSAGIYRSKNGGSSWERVSLQSPPGPPLRTANGIIYWAAPGVLLRSSDLGVSWVTIPIPGLRPIAPVEAERRIVAVGASTLVMTADNGATWMPVGPALPFEPHGVVYSSQRKSFFIWRGDCREFVPPNAVAQLQIGLPDSPRP